MRFTVLRHRGLVLLAVALPLMIGLVTALALRQPDAPTSRGPLPWISGASGDAVPGGRFATWRGRPVDIAGTWNDNAESQPNQWSVQRGFDYGSWRGDLDDAVGGINKDRGETWAAAASGAYDDRWRQTLTSLAKAWKGRPGTLYIRFAHEFNGDWYGWSVTGGEVTDFKAAWDRFRALQQEIFPSSKLVFCPNAETSDSLDLDWRDAFPGRSEVDVLGVDYYNQSPFVRSAAGFAASIDSVDSHGAPRGLEQHRAFAAAEGLPFAVPEWSSNADDGDGAVFVAQLFKWFRIHAGTGAGNVLYEIQFGVAGNADGNFAFYPHTKQQRAADAYRRLW